MDKKERFQQGQRIAKLGIGIVVFLTLAKAGVGFWSKSAVLFSDAVHSASDLLPIFISWLGLKISQKKPDKKFTYGYYKAESLGAGIVSLLIILTSAEILITGFRHLFFFSAIKVPLLALGVSAVDALILFFFGRYEEKIGKRINSPSLLTIGKENKTHLFSSTAVFIGILSSYYQIPYGEGIVTILIGGLIFLIGFSTAKEAVFNLMDISPGEEMEKKIAKIINSTPGIEGFFDLRLRKSGPFIFGEAKVGIRKSVEVEIAHQIADKIEKLIKQKNPLVVSFIVHIEPFKSDFHHLVFPIEKNNGLSSKIASKFGRAGWFLFVNLKNKKIKGFYAIKNTFFNKSVRAGLGAAKLIIKQKSDVLITPEIGEISFYALKENLIDVYQTKTMTISSALNLFKQKKLRRLIQPSKKSLS